MSARAMEPACPPGAASLHVRRLERATYVELPLTGAPAGPAGSEEAAALYEQAAAVMVQAAASHFLEKLDGRTAHRGDPEAQSRETLLALGALLEARGGSFDDVGHATVFCRRQAAWEGFCRAASSRRELRALPAVPVIADICRPDLPVEVEITALIGAGR